jgi:hypothetical protein
MEKTFSWSQISLVGGMLKVTSAQKNKRFTDDAEIDARNI